MIRIVRSAEPPELSKERARAEALLIAKVAAGEELRDSDFDGYQVAREHLWKCQHYKCAFCEWKEQRSYRPVEHFRPKMAADRRPGCPERHGYWWLAFAWTNMLFACPGCNGKKGIRFPLASGSVVLPSGQPPPGQELPLLLDPTSMGVDPIDHIEHIREEMEGEIRWVPRARNGSQLGEHTIRVCGLDREELVDMYTDHAERSMKGFVEGVRNALEDEDTARVLRAVDLARRALLDPCAPFVSLSLDALRHFIPDEQLEPFGRRWTLV